MSVTHIVGVDPGLVHTGVVSMVFAPAAQKVFVAHEAVAGPDIQATNDFITAPWPQDSAAWGCDPPVIFVEAYRPRAHLREDKRMVEALAEFRKSFPRAKVLDNTGIKKVVKTPLLHLLGVDRFSTPTHHGDLVSAARIAVLGMLKDPALNKLLADVVLAHLEGRDWHVTHQ